MKEILGFDNAIDYIRNLNLPSERTGDFLCKVCDELNFVAGNSTWFWKNFKPFKVKYNRKFMRFDIHLNNGSKAHVFLSAIKRG